ncbi:hypothetical protein PBRA_005262 [Plasmodiophora brassicae]|uniref:ABC transporter domain-containing protein n=1 Tax=Plasmodiophora brassicae TaxID=37360 RepID=A0A0G4IN13_PLABS|nr:hypothetical protein PBRA_005262 [Plasmodiophora brassicae]
MTRQSFRRQLRVFLWRNLLTKWRRRRETILEIAMPLLFVGLIGMMRGMLPPVAVPEIPDYPMTHAQTSTMAAPGIDDILAQSRGLRILFAPSATHPVPIPMLQQVVDRCRTKFSQAQSLELVPSEDVLLRAYRDNTVYAGVVLASPTAARWRMAIRMNGSAIPSTTNPMSSGGDVFQCTYYIDSLFLSLQAVVSESVAYVLGHGRTGIPSVIRSRAYPTRKLTVDPFIDLMNGIGGLYLVSGFVGFTSKLLFVLVQEKESRVREALKIMGISTLALWVSWLVTYAAITSVSSMFIAYAVLRTGLLPSKFMPELLLLIVCFCQALLALAFLMSCFFSNAKLAAQVGGLAILLIYSPKFFMSADSFWSAFFSPPIAFDRGFRQLLNVASSASDGGSSLIVCPLLMVVFSVIVFLLALYLDRVLPSKFGIRQPWTFPVTALREYFESPRLRERARSDVSLAPLMGDDGTEVIDSELGARNPAPALADSTITIRGLRKSFPGSWFSGKQGVVAVDSLDLDIQCSQITCLLGHNGAGKTTTLSMLTGLMQCDSGSAIMSRSVDLMRSMDYVRDRFGIGMCPQTDILFPELTTREHIVLVIGLKDVSPADPDTLVARYGLEEFAETKGSVLSGGQKRKLSLAMALIGDPLLVFLDEPSSGLDPLSRRQTWDTLQSYKAGRYVVLTTHSMDEADLLADRIVLLQHGKVAAQGSPSDLKRQFGIGYTLSVAHASTADQDAIRDSVAHVIPRGNVRSQFAQQLSFTLPITDAPKFPQLFATLDSCRNDLGITSFGVSLTSLEEVFFRLTDTSSVDAASEHVDSSPGPASSRVPADVKPLLRTRALALLRIFVLIYWRDFRALVYQIILPLIYVGILIISKETVLSFPSAGSGPSLVSNPSLSFSNASIFTSADVPVTSHAFDGALSNVNLRPMSIADSDALLSTLLDPRTVSTTVAIDGGIGTSRAVDVWHNCSSLHALPAALSIVVNGGLTGSDTLSLETVSDPFPFYKPQPSTVSDNAPPFELPFLLGIGFAYVPIGFGISVLRQKASGSRHLMSAMGLSPVLFWSARILMDTILYLVPVVMMFCMLYLSSSWRLLHDHGIDIFLGFFVNALNVLSFNAFLAAAMSSVSAYTSVASAVYIAGALALLVIIFLGPVSHVLVLGWADAILLALAPNFTMLWSLTLSSGAFDAGDTLPSLPSLYLATCVAAGLWFGVAVLLESGRVRTQLILGWRRFQSALPGGTPSTFAIVPDAVDDDVAREREAVREGYNDRSMYRDCVDQLSMRFGEKVAVRSISFGIKNGEIFGLLGPNGAGKSTTIKCLIGELIPTGGRARIDGKDLVKESDEIHKVLGFVPQSDALIDHLTGREHLRFFACLKGVKQEVLDAAVQQLVNDLGLGEFADRIASSYSGGNKRKLSMGIALIGANRILLLDEPSTGLDPHSRRRLRQLVNASRDARTTLLTTHSMSEADEMCTRLSIMVNGSLQCIGTSQHIKHKFGDAYQVDLTVEEGEGAIFLQEFEAAFPGCELVERYGSRLRFRLPGLSGVQVGAVFAFLERQRGRYRIRDYSMSQTTLDHIFVNFAREQVEDVS